MALLLAAATSGCISSTEPVLRDARAILGDRGQMEVFSPLAADGSRDVMRMAFQWRKDRYVVGAGRSSTTEFTVHAFEGRDLVVQWKTAELWSPKAKRGLRPVTYRLLRKIAEGAYLLFPLTEADVDEGTRARFCIKSPETTCRISTPEQLFIFARAAAEKEDQNPGIVVIYSGTKTK